ncbi:MAG: FKBP-type peptidyl-prolyl cis-trans isomerase [Ghiorsea sp.]|nr:FKBP-type peptidyl-prolyl cis-trans isomerase [Ghiorsea sp.]
MKIKIAMAMIVMAGLSACNDEKSEQTSVALDNEVKKFSYAMGMDVGQSIKGLGAEIDQAAFNAAVHDVLTGSSLKLEAAESTKIKQDFFRKKQEMKMAERKAAGAENKAKGEDFLAKNAKNDGVKVTPSGLQYEVLQQGHGAKPKLTDTVKVHYQGTLIDGTEFDSSYKRGKPISFPLNGVIKGWTEGVALMSVGSKYKFYIPSDLAYGKRGAGAKIAPNSTLIFTVELLGINNK